jgi:hypothetical protein
MKRYIAVIFAIICLALPSVGQALEGLPGSTWGDLHWEIPDSGDSNVILEGWVRQGIAWKSEADSQFWLGTTSPRVTSGTAKAWLEQLPRTRARCRMYSGRPRFWGVEHIIDECRSADGTKDRCS